MSSTDTIQNVAIVVLALSNVATLAGFSGVLARNPQLTRKQPTNQK
jgi:hypothetical protein